MIRNVLNSFNVLLNITKNRAKKVKANCIFNQKKYARVITHVCKHNLQHAYKGKRSWTKMPKALFHQKTKSSSLLLSSFILPERKQIFGRHQLMYFCIHSYYHYYMFFVLRFRRTTYLLNYFNILKRNNG